MIQRSGSSAFSPAAMRAATSRTDWTVALSSVSGSVKNWGACGSIAPPTMVVGVIEIPWSSGGKLTRGVVGLGRQGVGHRLDRAHDALVAGAAAEVPAHLAADLRFVDGPLALQQVPRGRQHAGRAEAALQPVLL